MKTQQTIAFVTGALVLFLALAAFTLSFDALQALALDNGINPALVWLVPLVIDGAIIVFGLSILRANLYGESARWAWALSIAFTVLSVAFNVVHALPTYVAQILSAIPPVALFLSFETLMGQLKMSVKRGQVGATLAQLSSQVQERKTEFDRITADLSRLTERKAAALAELEDIRRAKSSEMAEKSGNDLMPVDEMNRRRLDKIKTRRESVLKMLEANVPFEDIATQFGVSAKTIRRDIEKLNGRAHHLLEGVK